MNKIFIFTVLIISIGAMQETIIADSLSEKKEFLPNEILKDLDNKKVDVIEYLDSSPGLISFWFLACEPCKVEMKYLNQFNELYKESGFKVISINTDPSRHFKSVKPFIRSKKYSFKVLSDPRTSYQKKLKGTSCPYTVLVDHKGIITARHVGYNPGDENKIESEIIDLIQKAQADSLKDSTAVE